MTPTPPVSPVDTAERAPSRLAHTKAGHPLRTRSAKLLDKTRPFLAAGALSASDLAILDAASARFPLTDDAEVALALAFALAAPRQGHLGVELTKLGARMQDERLKATDADGKAVDLQAALPADLPAWEARVRARRDLVSEAVAHPDKPFVFQPNQPDSLVATTQAGSSASGILMTCRMWRQQRRLADALQQLAEQPADWVPDLATVQRRLDAIYPAKEGEEAEDNRDARHAAETVATSRLTVITGGPGTGKTWGIKRVLALLIESAQEEGRTLAIELAAPTGKAAVRMAEAMASEATIPGVAAETLAQLKALQPRTLHRLMGKLPHKPQGFRHGKSNRLGADIVVVDEASMIDVLMMRHLAEAIADGKRLVLLGDRDQLASVDAGTVLADVVSGVFNVEQRANNPALASSIVRLMKSHRFKLAASVACVAHGLQSREPDKIKAVVRLMCGDMPEITAWTQRIDADPRDDAGHLQRIVALTPPEKDAPETSDKTSGRSAERLQPDTLTALLAPYVDRAVENLEHDPDKGLLTLPPKPGYVAMLRERLWQGRDGGEDAVRSGATAQTDPEWHAALLDALGRYRILTPHRRGERGVAGLNLWLSKAIQEALVQPPTGAAGQRLATESDATNTRKLPRHGAFWLGQPVMITRNSYDVDLRNGDIGLILPRKTADGRRELSCVFPDPRAKTADMPGIRYVSLARLPAWETALAMTVHKSQGSQFDRIALVLPAESGSPILTRELIYTGLTRAKWRVDWVGEPEVLADALNRGVSRASGLAGLLWRA